MKPYKIDSKQCSSINIEHIRKNCEIMHGYCVYCKYGVLKKMEMAIKL